MKLLTVFIVLSLSFSATAQTKFSDLIGPVSVEPVKNSEYVQVPFITWGGDISTMLVNGTTSTTAPGSTYDKLGLKLKLVKGDDFVGQVRDYLSGKSPFLRCTYSQLGQASEVVGADGRTKPVVIMQLSYSNGDHIVSRQEIRNLNDLKGRKFKIALQQGGPHVGLLYDVFSAAQVSKNDVDIVWTNDLSGPNGPAELFKKDKTIDACCVISPDMVGLTSGLDKVGSGAEGTVKGSHVLVSTAQMSRSIADIYVVRSDYYKTHRDFVDKFVAGYLRGTEDLLALRKGFEETKKMSDAYRSILTVAQSAFGKDVIPDIAIDGHGLLMDCAFVGLPGQISFFEDRGNLNGFEKKMASALDLATTWGYAKIRSGFDPSGLDYRQIATLAGVKYTAPDLVRGHINAEALNISPDVELGDRTILSFTINFEPNQETFSVDQYGSEFARALQTASTFGNAVVVIRGHSDPTQTLVDVLRAGMTKGVIKRTGTKGNYAYYLNGKVMDVTQTADLIKLIKNGDFEGVDPNPRETMAAALNLSQSRANAVKAAVIEMAKKQGITLDVSQIQPVGAGIMEPVIAKPADMKEARQNMRVEFRIIKVPAEAIKSSDFDF